MNYLKRQMMESGTKTGLLAEKCGWSVSVVSQMRNGFMPISIRHAVKLEAGGKEVGCPLVFEKLVPEDAELLKTIGIERIEK